MNAFPKTGLAIAALLLLAGHDGFAQFDRRGGDTEGPFVRTEGGVLVNEDTVRTARETVSHSTGTPTWANEPGFEKDVFTFARIIFKSQTNGARRFMRGGFLGWSNDYPDSDLNLSWRLQELTALRTDPDGRVLKLTNPDLFDYPLIYMVKPGRMELRDDEAPILRKYLEAGGALWADDFWGEPEWDNFEHEMQRVLPGRHWQELPMEHPLFHCVFDLKPPKENLQVPPIHIFERTGSSSRNGAETREVHMRAWFDDKGRIMILATHNTDNGDGWEREGEDPEYFQKFSEGRAYPLAFNVIFYLMTH